MFNKKIRLIVFYAIPFSKIFQAPVFLPCFGVDLAFKDKMIKENLIKNLKNLLLGTQENKAYLFGGCCNGYVLGQK